MCPEAQWVFAVRPQQFFLSGDFPASRVTHIGRGRTGGVHSHSTEKSSTADNADIRGSEMRLSAILRVIAGAMRTMNDAKSIWASKTIWGLIITLICLLMSVAGHPATDAQKTDLGQVAEVAGALVGIALAGVGRVTATKRIGKKFTTEGTEGTEGTENTNMKIVNSFLLSAFCFLPFLGGCAQDNATTLYVKSASTERIVLQAVITYDQVATATAVPSEEKTAVLRTARVGTDALAALTDSLKANSDAYRAARAAGNDVAAAEATNKARIAFDGVNAVATKLLVDLAEMQKAENRKQK